MGQNKKKYSAPTVSVARAQPGRPLLKIAEASDGVAQGSLLELSRAKRNLALCLLLAIATLIVYAPVVRHSFINYDDGAYIYDNPHVKSGLTWQNVRWSFTAIEEGNWHPTTWISHQLDWQIFGIRAGGHHLTSLLFHIANTILLFFLLSRVTGATWPSFMVAALFGLHPLNVESVAWVAERKNVLCTFFFLVTLGVYGWYARRPSWRRYSLIALFFFLGLASKPMVITLPFVLLLLDYWPLGRIEKWSNPSTTFPVPQAQFSRLLLEKLPLLMISAGSAVITVIAQRRANAMPPDSAWGFDIRIENAIHSYATYLWRTFWPKGLAPFYPGMVLASWQVWLAGLFLLAVSLSIFFFRARRPFLTCGFLWFLGTLVPVIGLVQVGAQSMADRYAYIPLIGVFVALVWGVREIGERGRANERWLLASFAAVLVTLSVITRRQLDYWRDSSVLWSHALEVTPSNYVAELNLAISLTDQNRDDEALPHFENVREIRPDDVVALVNIGNNQIRHRQYSEAIQTYRSIIPTHEDPAQLSAAYRGIAIAYAQLGDHARARENFLTEMRLNPGDSTEYYNLSMLEIEDGIDKLSKVVADRPTPEAYVQLAQLLQQDRQAAQAKIAYQKALELNPHLAEAKQALEELSRQ